MAAQQGQEEKRVPVYFIGTHFRGRPPFFVVKGRVYPDTANGQPALAVGQPIMVLEQDVKPLLEKGRAFLGRNKGFAEAFTLDPQIAATVLTRHRDGEEVVIGARLTVEQALDLVTTEEVKEKIVNDMSTEELEALLAARQGKAEEVAEKPRATANRPGSKAKQAASVASNDGDEGS